MSVVDLINRFQENNNVHIDGQIINTINRILTVSQDNKSRETTIREYIRSEYPKVAKEYERNKVHSSVLKADSTAQKTPVEFFEEYINFISDVVKESSDRLAEEAEKEAIKADELVKTTKADFDDKKTKHDELLATQKKNNGSEEELANNPHFVKNYTEPMEFAKINWENATEKQNRLVAFKPYESTMDYFGLSEPRTLAMLENQVNSCTYMDARRAQIETAGVTAPAYMQELADAFKNNVTYGEANADDKKRMQEVYATKQLMQEKLDSKKGLSGWLWKLFHRTETKAMKKYVKDAGDALSRAGFGDNNVEEANIAMSEKGYFYNEYQKSGAIDVIKEKFAENEKVYAPIRAYKAELKAVAQKPIKDQYLEIKFRPSTDSEIFKEQVKAFNEVKPLVEKMQKDGTIPEDVCSVFKANSKKLKLVSDLYKREKAHRQPELHKAESICEEVEKALMDKGAHDNYTPMKYEELVALNVKKVSISISDDVIEKPQELSKPVTTSPVLQQDTLAKQ